MDVDLHGLTALVSGSTQGIGYAIAAGLASAGADVVVNGREPSRTEEAAARLRSEVPGAEVLAVAADLATAEGAEILHDRVPDLDVVVNNLGIFGAKPALEITDDPGVARTPMLCCATPGHDVCCVVVVADTTAVSDSSSALHPPHLTAARDERGGRATPPAPLLRGQRAELLAV